MDFLSTIRAHYYALIVVCVAALITVSAALSDSTLALRRAYQDLGNLQRINDTPLASQVSRAFERLVDLPSASKPGSYVRVRVHGGTEQDGADILDVGAEPSAETLTRLLRVAGVGEPFSEASLRDITRAFGIATWVPLPRDQELAAVRDCVARHNPAVVVVDVKYRTPRTDLATFGEIAEEERPATAKVTVSGDFCSEPRLYLEPLSDIIEPRYTGPLFDALALGGSSEFDFPDSPFSLADFSSWETVADLTVQEARIELRRRLEGSPRVQPVFGLTAYWPFASVAFPAAILLLQFMLWAHVTAAIGRVSSEHLGTFAWVGLYGSTISVLITRLTLQALPAISLAGMGLAAGWWRNIEGGISLLSGIVVAIMAGALVQRAVRDLKTSAVDEQRRAKLSDKLRPARRR